MSRKMFLAPNHDEVLYSLDIALLSMMLAQTAACVVQAVSVRSVEEDNNKFAPIDPAFRLARWVNWAPHGYTNALQSHVEFLFAFAEAWVHQLPEAANYLHIIEPRVRKAVCEALRRYQNWKTAYINEQKKNHGEGWGDATGFNQMDWTKYNSVLENGL